MENNLIAKAQSALGNFMSARLEAQNALIEIVKEKGGFISTIPTHDKCEIRVMRAVDSYDCSEDTTKSETVFGFRYIENEGLFICTETCLENYEYDHLYDFFSFIAPDEGDVENINKALEDLAYYENFDNDEFIKSTSLISILGSIAQYI